MRAAIENARQAGLNEGSGEAVTKLPVRVAAVLPPVVLAPPPAIPAPTDSPSTIVATINADQPGKF